MTKIGICNLSIAPLRADKSDKSEIVSQLLFGDSFTVIDQVNNWLNIRTDYDNYVGWIDEKQCISDDNGAEMPELTTVLGPKPYHAITRHGYNQPLYLLAGTSLPEIVNDRFFLGRDEYTIKNAGIIQPGELSVSEIAKFYVNAPYLWGGRSIFGIDCSGFTQIVFKMLGRKLLRDASEQANQGENVDFLQAAKPGDLAFFDNEEGRITHVGIMLDDQQIIHASGRVKIDRIDDQGIYSMDLKRHSHKLRIIKRIL